MPVRDKVEREKDRLWLPLPADDHVALLQFVRRVEAMVAFVRKLLAELEGPSNKPPRARRRRRTK